MFEKTVLGGTFDGLHAGHKRLLETAFNTSRDLLIGLTGDEFANRFRTKVVKDYQQRKKILDEYCSRFDTPYRIVEINDNYGFATVQEDLDAIVVSEETLLRAQEINTIRYKKDLSKLTIIVVPLVLDEKGRPLSNSR